MRSPCVALPIPKVHGHLGGDLEIEILEDVDDDDDDFPMIVQVVVSNMFVAYSYLEKWLISTDMFRMGWWHHRLDCQCSKHLQKFNQWNWMIIQILVYEAVLISSNE